MNLLDRDGKTIVTNKIYRETEPEMLVRYIFVNEKANPVIIKNSEGEKSVEVAAATLRSVENPKKLSLTASLINDVWVDKDGCCLDNGKHIINRYGDYFHLVDFLYCPSSRDFEQFAGGELLEQRQRIFDLYYEAKEIILANYENAQQLVHFMNEYLSHFKREASIRLSTPYFSFYFEGIDVAPLTELAALGEARVAANNKLAVRQFNME